MNIYENCPILQNDRLMIRLIEQNDTDDLMAVYHDKFALPFFNSDNCNGSNFYCAVKEDMANTIRFWLLEYHENQGFVRFTIMDRKEEKAIGTIEMFRRESEDYYNDCGLLRVDVGSGYEKAEMLYEILSLITEPFYDWFGCSMIATKAPLYAIERIEALRKAGFSRSGEPLVNAQSNIAYYDYWIKKKESV